MVKENDNLRIESIKNCHRLIFNNVTQINKGIYIFQATNEFGSVLCEFNLDVLSKF